MFKSLLSVLLLSIFLSLPVLAQDITVSGRVTSSDDGSGLPGVSVQVKGTSRGTTTDGNGNYRITASPSAQLVFSFIGYLSQEVNVGNRSELNITLRGDAAVLNEVVVVGYGTQSKKTITGAIASVDGKSISDKPVQSFDQALQGRAAGVSITTPNGVLNNPPVIRVRGVSSISGTSSPLIVIDGLPINSGNVSSGGFTVNNPLGDINPNDIESLDILKDASATAIYGSRAAAGVILITTKKGKEGRAQVSYDGWASSTQAFRLFDMLNAQQFMDYKNLAARNAGLADQFFPTLNPDGSIVDTDWYDLIYRTGYGQNHNLNVNGGTKDTRYAFSVGYTNQQGMIQKNDFRRITGRMNISHQLNKAVKVGANISLANSFNQSPNTGTIGAFSTGGLGRLPLVLAPNVAPRNPDGSYNINRAANNLGLGKNLIGPGGYYNPLPDLELSKFTSENNHIIGNVFADVNLLPGLVFRTSYGLDQTNVEDIDFRNSIHGEAGNLGQATNIYTNIKQWNWQNYLTYDFTFLNRNNVQAVVGTEAQQQSINLWSGQRQGLSDPFFTTYQGSFTNNQPPPAALQTQNNLISYYGRLNYNYDQKYLLSFTLRRDGFSAYAQGNKWGNFPGASAGYRVSEEAFWKNSALGRVLNEFKLRASWGRVGNTGIGNFASLSLFNSGLYGSVPTFVFAQAGNPNLRWEISTNVDVGVNFGLFNDRITGEITYYNKQLNDLVLNEPQAPSRGIPGNSIATNVGSMVNRGFEFALTTNNVTAGKFNWTSSFNLTTLQNEVLALANNNADIFGQTGGLESSNIIRVGESAGSIFAIRTNGVNPANGQRIFINAAGREVQYNHAAAPAQRWTYVSDGAVAPAIQGTDRVVIGNALPKYYGGFDNTFRYGNLDFSVFLQYSGGNYIYNGTKAGLRDQRPWNNHTDVLNHWKQAGDVTNIPRPVLNDNVSNGSANPISENVEKGDFIRGRNILLAYTLRNDFLRKANIASLRVYGQVQNAFVITNYTGADPEISTNRDTNIAPGVDRNSTPQARTFTLGLGMTF